MRRLSRHLARKVPRHRGFTLLELMVVLLIIALASGLVGVKVAGTLAHTTLRTAAKRSAAMLRYARTQAVALQEPYRARFELDGGTLQVGPEGKMPQEGEEEAAREVQGAEERFWKLPEGIRFAKAILGDKEMEGESFSILFFPVGNSTGGEVVLEDGRERRYAVAVDTLTGSVRVREVEEG